MSKAISMAKQIAKFDGWKNILTGLGIKGRDKRESAIIEWEILMESPAENLYSQSDVAGKIVDEVISESFREGYTLKADDMPTEIQGAINDERERLKVDEKFQEAWRFARLYGGGAIIVIPRDITKLSQPFIPESVDEIQSLLVLTRWELPRGLIEYDIRSPNFGMPKNYRICPRGGAGETNGVDVMNEEVHHSRVLRFDGAFLPRINFLKNNHWHDSILNKAQRAIRDYDIAMSSVSATLEDFSIGVMKISGLQQALSEDNDGIIMKRMEINSLAKSVAKMIVLDADKESYEYQDRQLSGVADCVKLVAGRLVVASNMPHTKILGESPLGSNATGNSTTKDWLDHVKSQQVSYVDCRLLKLWKWILLAKKSPTGGKLPVGLKIHYPPLWQEPASVQADIRLKTAQADASDIAMSVLQPTEVAISRYGSGDYSTQTTLTAGTSAKDRKLPPPAPVRPPARGQPVTQKDK